MTPESQIKALAELDGLEVRLEYGPQFDGGLFNEQEIWTIHRHKDLPHDWIIWKPKLYRESYDVIIPLIQKQWKSTNTDEGVRWQFLFWNALMDSECMLFNTPTQLSEALLRATGKWKE